MRFKDKCFLFKGKKDDLRANWSYARTWCKEQGGELAVIDDQYENGELKLLRMTQGQRTKETAPDIFDCLLQTLCRVI